MTSTTAVTDPAAPKVREAHGPAGDKLDIKDFYSADHVTVQVPQYTGMARGHTVRITWENPRHTHHSEVITVGTPGTIDIPIPRLEAIDSIGHTVKINYTVRTAPGTALIPSRYLLLQVLPQQFDLLAPTLSSDQKTLSVNYAGMTTGYTVRIRAVANTTWLSDERPVQAGVTPTFLLPSDWLTTNRRANALINYTVYKSGSGERLMFSKVLRVRIGEAATAVYENFSSTPLQQFYLNTPATLASGLTIKVLRNGVDPTRIEFHLNIVRSLLIPSNSLIEFSWKDLATRINLEIIDIHKPNTITFFDLNGNNIATRYLPYPTGHAPITFEYIAPTGQHISHFNIDATPESASDEGFLITLFKID